MSLNLRYSPQELRLLELLADRYPTITAAHLEMVELQAMQELPKGTDHYLSDIHGAYLQFDHILRHASGSIQRKIEQAFGARLSPTQKVELALLIYYPEVKLRQLRSEDGLTEAWLSEHIVRLVEVAQTASQHYSRRKVRGRLEPQLANLLEELLSETGQRNDQKNPYYQRLIAAILELGEGERVIRALAYLIQNLVVDRLNVIGDIYDRGPAAEEVMDRLMRYHDVSVQWGNHDIAWMGAASGSMALVANVVRIALRYATLDTLVSGYGISLRKLQQFADATYTQDPAETFSIKLDSPPEDFTPLQLARMQKAITMMQFKLEAEVIHRHPEYHMEDRLLLEHMDIDAGSVELEGKDYPLLDCHWPTFDCTDPSKLSAQEAAIMQDLTEQFTHSPRLQAHVRFLFAYGNMFEVQDGNLKYHGCLPVDELGDFIPFTLAGETLSGPALLQRFEELSRNAFLNNNPHERREGQDAMWYLWCGKDSPLYGRSRMATFERYLIAEPETHQEAEGIYYTLRDNLRFVTKVLAAFGADAEQGFIINGHTPVKVKKGASPLLAEGRMIIIDGGMSAAYQQVTGIAGYTLVGNSFGLMLATHEPFASAQELIASGQDVTPKTAQITEYPKRKLIKDTDQGVSIRGRLDDLRKLVAAYRQGILVERPKL